jgi:uncharacterized DUF497 family protein
MHEIWDEPKRQTNIAAQGSDFADVRDKPEWATAQIVPFCPSCRSSPHCIAVDYLYDDLVARVCSPLGTEAISAISLRPASRKERRRYEDEG